jgi:diaminopimelate epimerase
MMPSVEFRKMHGLGNDFVVLDARSRAIPIAAPAIRALADRHTGIGFDQLIILEPPREPSADAFMRILNADGGEAGACGNATRCVAVLIMAETGRDRVAIQTIAGVLPASRAAGGLITVDMGPARLRWDDIPLAHPTDTLTVPIALDGVGPACCSNMGNPHATFFVADADAVDLARVGPLLEHDPMFPKRANIGFATLVAPNRLRLRVWERGAGLTLACGSGACAALVAAARRGLTARSAAIVMERGELAITWAESNHVLMTGPAATAFTGRVELAGAA